jgi:hypothetical protein
VTNYDGAGYPPIPPPSQFGNPPGYPPYPPPQYSAPPARRRTRRWPWIAGAIVAVAVVLLAIGGYAVTRGGSSDKGVKTATVTYEITGAPGSITVTYYGSDGHRFGPQAVTLPWQKQVEPRGENAYLSVAAERADSSNEPLVCRITSNSRAIAEHRSAGGFVFCSGRTGQN